MVASTGGNKRALTWVSFSFGPFLGGRQESVFDTSLTSRVVL